MEHIRQKLITAARSVLEIEESRPQEKIDRKKSRPEGMSKEVADVLFDLIDSSPAKSDRLTDEAIKQSGTNDAWVDLIVYELFPEISPAKLNTLKNMCVENTYVDDPGIVDGGSFATRPALKINIENFLYAVKKLKLDPQD